MGIAEGSHAESAVTVPAANATVITPANSDLASNQATRAIYVGGVGDLAVKMLGTEGDTTVIFSAVPAGTLLPIRATQIRLTGTTATLIVAIW